MFEKKKIITASLWVVGVFGLSQLLRLGSNLVVTRLLEPEMFGVMAIVYIIMNGVTMFSDLGLRAFIIQHKNGTNDNFLNTIWTMQIVRGWMLSLIVVLIGCSILIMNHIVVLELDSVYRYMDLPMIIFAVATTAVITGYRTMAPAVMSRGLKRGKLELIDLISQLIATSVMIFLAWKYVSIWALVSSAIIVAVVQTILTYHVFDVKHKLAWDKQIVSEVFHFGKWIVLASALTFLAMQGDRLIFSTYVSAAELGIYSIAFMLASVIASVIEKLSANIWLPVLSRIANEKLERLKEKYYEIRLKQDIIVFTGIGALIAIAPEMIEFLYDKRFHEAGWMMQIILIGIIGTAISRPGISCLTALGQTKIRMKIMFVRAITLIISLPILFSYFGFIGAIWGVAINNFIALPVQYVEMKKQNIFSLFLELRILPIVALSYWLSSLLMG